MDVADNAHNTIAAGRRFLDGYPLWSVRLPHNCPFLSVWLAVGLSLRET